MRILRRLILIAILLFSIWALSNLNSYNLETNNLESLSFDGLRSYFTKLSKEKGAKYAYEILKKASVAPNTDMHLLGHVVGDILYEQQGAEGIQICTQDFRNACSHSIVVGLFTEKGVEALSEIQEACKKAPGGIGAYIMCYHGLGHGILAFAGYDFSKTIKLCQKTGTSQYSRREYPECVSGAVMEIISGGGHNRELWQMQRPKYLKIDNPFYICSPPFMPEDARARCYDYIAPYLWEVVGADINNPNERDFANSFKLCEQVSQENYRRICFGGFGKEFVGLAQSKDIRKVDQMSDDKLRKVVNWCQIAVRRDAVNACLLSALSSIYWGGENDYHVSIRFCNVIEESESYTACFLNLIDQATYFIRDPKTKESVCRDMPDQFIAECKKRLS